MAAYGGDRGAVPQARSPRHARVSVGKGVHGYPGDPEATSPIRRLPTFAEAISEWLDRLAIGPRYLYLHDFGAPAGFHIAMQTPERVLGLIVQNANAHRTGFGPGWAGTLAYWAQPNPENEAAIAHLTGSHRALCALRRPV